MKHVAKAGWYEANGRRIWMRSGWELRYAKYLDILIRAGIVKSWEYEPREFWFENIKRGTRSYKPDFEVTMCDQTVQYHEIKGHMDQVSRTKLKRMAKYYPEVKVEVFDGKRLRALLKNF